MMLDSGFVHQSALEAVLCPPIAPCRPLNGTRMYLNENLIQFPGTQVLDKNNHPQREKHSSAVGYGSGGLVP